MRARLFAVIADLQVVEIDRRPRERGAEWRGGDLLRRAIEFELRDGHRLRHRRTPELQVANLDPPVERCGASVAARPEVDSGRAAGLRPRGRAETEGVRRFEQAVERNAVALAR